MEPTDNDQFAETTETPPNNHSDETKASGKFTLSRRSTLTGLAGLGILAGEASAQNADPKSRVWKTDVDADGRRLLNLGALTMLDNPTEIIDFEGPNLSIGPDGLLGADMTAVSDNGSLIVESTETLDFGTNLHVSDDGDGVARVDADQWDGDVIANSHTLSELESLTMSKNDKPITDFAGSNLSIDDSGTLHAGSISNFGSFGASVTEFTNNLPAGESIPIVFDTVEFNQLGITSSDEYHYINTDGIYEISVYVGFSIRGGGVLQNQVQIRIQFIGADAPRGRSANTLAATGARTDSIETAVTRSITSPQSVRVVFENRSSETSGVDDVTRADAELTISRVG